jgi:hypothetical protein
MTSRTRGSWAAAVFVLAAFARGFFLWHLRESPFPDFPIVDAKEYHDWALAILGGRGLLASWPDHSPAYSLFLAAVYARFDPSPWPVFALQALLGAASALLCFQAAWRCTRSLLASVVTGAFAAAAWPFVYFSGELLPPSLEIFLISLSLYCLSGEEAPSWISALTAGGALGLACSMRPQLLPAALVLAAAWRFCWPKASRKSLAAFVLPVLLLAFSWQGYLRLHGVSTFLQTRGGLNLYLGNHAGATGRAADFPGLDYFALRDRARRAGGGEDAYFLHEVRTWAVHDPLAAAGLELKKIGLVLTRHEIPAGEPPPWPADGAVPRSRRLDFAILLAAGLPGLLIGARRRWGSARALLIFFASGVAAISLAAVAARYRAPLLPVLALGAGFTALAMKDWIALGRWKPLGVALLSMLLLFSGSTAMDAAAGVHPRRDLAVALALQARAGGGEARRASASLKDWLAEHADDADAAWHLGVLQAHLRDWTAAERTFSGLALSRGVEYPYLYASLAWLRALTGDVAGARDAATASYRRDPRSLDACLRSVLYSQLADPTLRIERALCACPLDPSDHYSGSPEAESFAGTLRTRALHVDTRVVLPDIEERSWASDDYPAADMRAVFSRQKGSMISVDCSRL